MQGSGKSTIINRIRSYKVGDRRSVDFGIYINADDIAAKLRSDRCNFSDYDILFEPLEFKQISGLLNADFSIEQFERSIIISENTIAINLTEVADKRVAQIIADYQRVKLLTSEKKLSFETIFQMRE